MLIQTIKDVATVIFFSAYVLVSVVLTTIFALIDLLKKVTK